MPLLALALAAQAAEPTAGVDQAAAPAEVPPVHVLYPTALSVDGTGRTLRLLDADHRELPTQDALLLVGAPAAAEAYTTARQNRRKTAILLWLTGGEFATTSFLLNGYLEGDPAFTRVGTVALLAAPALAGSGFLVWFTDPRRHVGAWVSEAAVTDAVATHNRAVEERTPENVEARAAAVAARQLYVDFDGRVVDADRHPYRMPGLMRRIDDERTEHAWLRQRHRDKVTWGAATAFGGGLVVVGAGLAGVGFVTELFGDPSDLPEMGAVTMGIGGVGAGIGLTGLFASKIRHDDPRFWYDEPMLRYELDAYTRELETTYGVHPGARVEVHPVIAPGAIGVAGTF